MRQTEVPSVIWLAWVIRQRSVVARTGWTSIAMGMGMEQGELQSALGNQDTLTNYSQHPNGINTPENHHLCLAGVF